ncbi:Alpha/beta hydrolase [Burkholderiales bacterium 8X]|nr:Alpha/beta hydrolase [Burkholderiales bacterium 8X]
MLIEMLINYVRRGEGKPLLLVHGLGSSWRSWATVMRPLAAERAVVAIDLPGFGKSPALKGEVTIETLATAVTEFLCEHDLIGTDAVGCSVGARLVLELASRRDVVGTAISLGPGGFWQGWERWMFHGSLWGSIRMIRALQFAMPAITQREWSRRMMLAQFSASGSALSASMVLNEMRSYASATSFDLLLAQLVRGAAPSPFESHRRGKRLVIGWGRSDRVCLPRQAARAQATYPEASLHWFERCGHFPHWDAPEETARLILEATAD